MGARLSEFDKAGNIAANCGEKVKRQQKRDLMSGFSCSPYSLPDT